MSENQRRNDIDACAPEDCASCSSDCGSRLDLNARVIELTTDDGEKMRCLIMLKYKMEGKEYIAVAPLQNNPDGDIYLFRMVNGGTGLQNIEDPDEYNDAARTFGIEMEKAECNASFNRGFYEEEDLSDAPGCGQGTPRV